MLLIAAALTTALSIDVPTITIDRDNIEITQSCRVRIAQTPIIDADNNGVIHITASDIILEFTEDSSTLHGANDNQTPDTFAGKGIVITGRNVTLAGDDAKVSGYKVGIHAIKANGLTIHHIDVSNNFHQRLKSTPQAEDASDWLWPHANDNNEWITNYGAGLCVEDSSNVTLHDIRARKTQNGIILDAVNDSKVYDCDCSFLSGWGLAMWRSNRNVVSRNAFDFCVRGYSHGVYNRGQDSAGILMFEQCCENVIAENSATHGGDGFFGFAGKEALGEVNPREDLEWYKGRGNNDNWFVRNDFSCAAAHGLELTFSFRNWIENNRFTSNAICGIWGGYSQSNCIEDNVFTANGQGAYGGERGGINIEHGTANQIAGNTFIDNSCGVRLWCDDDGALRQTPWARANYPQTPGAEILSNRFHAGQVALEFRNAGLVQVENNEMADVQRQIDADGQTLVTVPPAQREMSRCDAPHGIDDVPGAARVQMRDALAGRHNIIMTEWGPWDHEEPLLQYVQRFDHADEYRMLGSARKKLANEHVHATGEVFVDVEGDRVFVRPRGIDTLIPYELAIDLDGDLPLTARGLLTGGSWTVKTFASPCDPREDAEGWRAAASSPDAHTLTCDPLDLPFGSGSMSEARHLPVKLPRDHFGTISTRTLTFPPGHWRITTTSDDGIRVWMNQQLVIDDWTHHAPKKHTHDFEVAEGGRTINFRVEHFELDGHAVLQLDIAPALP